MKLFAVTMLFIVGTQVDARAACSNPINTISIPTSGSTTVGVCDQSGNFLTGPYTVQVQNSFTLNATTTPALNVVGGNLVFIANGAVSGASGNLNICFTPANKCNLVPYVVGTPVTSISFGTP